MDARLTLTHLESQYELACPPDQVVTLRNELDGIARDRLPQVLAEQLLPQIDPNYSVYRIRNIDIDLAISRQALKSGELPRLWARQILQQVFTELRYGDGLNVVRFADHAEFTAAFVHDLVLGGTARSWAFDDFAALRLLSPAEAITQLLVARPSYFAQVADYFRRQGDVRRLASTLNAEQVSRVLESLRTMDARPVKAAQLCQCIGYLDGLLPMLEGDEQSAAQQTLLFLLQVVPQQIELKQAARVLLELSEQAVQLQHALRQSAARHRPTMPLEDDRMTPDPRVIADDLPPIVRDWWLRLLSEADGERYLGWLLRQVGPGSNVVRSLAEQPTTGDVELQVSSTKRSRADVTEYISPFAGMGLLLSGIADLKLTKLLGLSRVRACTGALLSDKQRLMWERDPLCTAWFPPEDARPQPANSSPGEPASWPLPSESMLVGLGPEQRQAVEDAAEAGAWALLLAVRFARRLPGLEASSLDYLSKQFFARPGRVRIDAKSICVRLEPMPLGIVLKLAGCGGWQGRLPWLGERELTIELPAG